MTISNVRQTRARLHPIAATIDNRVGHRTTAINIERQNQQRKTDHTLLTMLFVQVLLILVFTLPIALSKLYTTISRNTPKSALQNTTENFIFNFFLLLGNIPSGMPFYIYILSGGRVYRKALFNLMDKLRRKIMYQCRRFL